MKEEEKDKWWRNVGGKKLKTKISCKQYKKWSKDMSLHWRGSITSVNRN